MAEEVSSLKQNDVIIDNNDEKGKNVIIDNDGEKGKDAIIDNDDEKGKDAIIDNDNEKGKDAIIDNDDKKGKDAIIDNDDEKGKDAIIDNDNEKGKDAIIDNDDEKGKDAIIDNNDEKGKDAIIDNDDEKGKDAIIDDDNEKGKDAIIDNDNEKGKDAIIDNDNEKGKDAIIDNDDEKGKDAIIDNDDEKRNDDIIDNKDDEKNITRNDRGFSLEKLNLFLLSEKLNLGPKRKLLVLCLGGLLVYRVHRYFKPEMIQNLDPDASFGNYLVYKRPFCDEFIEFCFERFDVGIWSCAKKQHIDDTLNCAMKQFKSKLLFVWDQDRCTETGFQALDKKDKPIHLKELSKLWENKDSSLPWRKGQYSSSNTLLIDDMPYQALLNPPNTAIFPEQFKYNRLNNTDLSPRGALRLYLDGLANANDVPSYVRKHPIGWPPVRPSHKDWAYYSKIIRSIDNKRAAEKSREPAEKIITFSEKKSGEAAEKKSWEAAEKKIINFSEKKSGEAAEKKSWEAAEKKSLNPSVKTVFKPEKKIINFSEKKSWEAAEKNSLNPSVKKVFKPAEKKILGPTEEKICKPIEKMIWRKKGD